MTKFTDEERRAARKPKGSTKQLELYVPPKPRYAVPEAIAIETWKKLRRDR